MSKENLEFQAKRIKFSLKKFAREDLLDQFEKACHQLDQLLATDDQVTAAYQQINASRSVSLINQKTSYFWRHAERLHEALTKAWRCDCANHTAKLGLASLVSDRVEFDILFHLKAAVQRGTRITMVANAGDVSIAAPQQNMQTRLKGNSVLNQTAQHPQEPITLIRNLCSALSSNCANCIGFLEEDDCRFIVYHDTTVSKDSNQPTTSLLDLLEDNIIFTRQRRFCPALTLATSFLRLGATPWLNTRLRKDSIIFLSDPNDVQVTNLDQPYITKEMLATSANQPTNALASLGMRLLELCFGQHLEATQYRKDLGAGDAISAPMLDLAAARQWSERAVGEAGLGFAGAIGWCLGANELGNANWREEFLQFVVLPLEACHNDLAKGVEAVRAARSSYRGGPQHAQIG